ncbi:MAG TPA: vWA domain-containing protein [Rectinemataceae bacterium]|nr:vWA domain-containing protein [Rectinemataceae bacterium]
MRTRCVTTALLAVFLTAGSFCLHAADSSFTGDGNATDVVVLLDVSQSVLPYFNDVTDYVVSDVVKNYLRFGDTFHLLSFGDTTQVEIAEKVTDAASVKSFLGRLYLLYPLARHSDFAGALSYLYQYLSDLPESRPKVVVVITDGVNNPPEGSRTYGMSPDKVAADIEATAAKIRANGWPVHFIKLPLLPPGSKTAVSSSQVSPSEVKGGRSYLDDAAKSMDADVSVFSSADKADLASMSLALPSVEFPPDLGKKDYAFSFPLKITNKSVSSLGLELDHVQLDNIDILSRKSFLTLAPGKSGTMNVSVLLPNSLAQGHERLDVALVFSNGLRVNPQHGIIALTLQRSILAALFRSSAKVALFIALVAIGLFLAFLFAILLRQIPRRSSEAPVIAAVRESAERSATRKPASEVLAAATAAGASPAAGPARPATAASKPAVAALETAAAGASSDAASLLADSASARAAARRSEQAATTGLLAEAARSAATVEPSAARAAPSASPSLLPSAAELAAAKRGEAQKEAALLAEAAEARSPAHQAAAASAREDSAVPSFAPRVVKTGSISVELRVEGQNPHIGTRNVHKLHAGSFKTVGGGRSDFLVFLMTVPGKVAELHFDGERLTLVPRRPEFFPDGASPIEDCLGKEIRMQGKRGYPLILRFLPFERSADKMNRLLHCIETPGLFTTPEV